MVTQDNQQRGETTAKKRARTDPHFLTCDWFNYLAGLGTGYLAEHHQVTLDRNTVQGIERAGAVYLRSQFARTLCGLVSRRLAGCLAVTSLETITT